MEDRNHVTKHLARRSRIAAVVVATIAAAWTLARAPSAYAHSPRLELHADLAWYGALGFGGRIDVPISGGFIAPGGTVRDDISLSPGVDVFLSPIVARSYQCGANVCGERYSGVVLGVPLGLQWNLYFGRHWSIFPEVGLEMLFGDYFWYRHYGYHEYPGPWFGAYTAFGVRFHFSDTNSIMARVTWPQGLQIGLTF